GVEDLDDVAGPQYGDAGAVGAVGDRPDLVFGGLVGRNLTGAGDVPDPQAVRPVAHGDQAPAVRAQRQGTHVAALGQDDDRLAGGGVPEAHAAVPGAGSRVPGAGGDPAAVGRVRHRVDVAGVAAQDRQRGARPRVPQAHDTVVLA